MVVDKLMKGLKWYKTIITTKKGEEVTLWKKGNRSSITEKQIKKIIEQTKLFLRV